MKKSTSCLKEFRQKASIKALKFFLWAMGKLPRGFVHFILACIFPLVYPFLTALRIICRRNLQSVYGDSKTPEQYQMMTKQCIRNISRSMMDMLYFVDRPQEFKNNLNVVGEEHLKKAIAAGKGVMAVTAHLINTPSMFFALAQMGYRVNVVIRPMRDQYFSQFMFDLCAKWKMNMIPLFPQKKFLKDAVHALKENELLFILIDEEVPGNGGVKVKFFDKEVNRAIGPTLFHERMGSPIIAMFMIHDDQRKFTLFIEPAVQIEKHRNVKESHTRNISLLTKIIERYVKSYPLQWGGWLNKRWH